MATISDKAMQAKPAATDRWLIEDGARGEGRLVGRITPAGARAFYFRYTASSGGRVRLPIGSYDPRGNGKATFTVQQARDRARELSALYRSGVRDLREHFERLAEHQRRADEAARQAAEEAERAAAEVAAALARRHTVRTLFASWQRAELTPQVQADGRRTGRKDGGEWVRLAFERRVFPRIGDVPAEQVKRADLLAIVDDAKAGGTLRTAQVLLTDLRQMFSFASEREIVPFNPLDGIKKSKVGGRSAERKRTLSDDEITALSRALPQARMAPRSEAAVWLILTTGVRVGECMGAVWAAEGLDGSSLAAVADAEGTKFGIIDVAARTWHLPTTKNERDHTIHLSDLALAQLTRLAALREVDEHGEPVPWVFPATDRTRPVCVKSFGKQVADRQLLPDRRMSRRSKATQSLALPGGKWTAHDLRRTAGTLMAALGISGDVIDECLNHVIESRVRRTYIHDRRLVDQARAFDALGQHLAQLVSSGAAPASNVVALAQRAA